MFELGAGFVAEIRWERSKGAIFKTDASFTPSAVKARWNEITDFSHPEQYVIFAILAFDKPNKLTLLSAL